MKKNSTRMVFILVLFALIIASCQRSASVNPSEAANPEEQAVQEPTENHAQELISATQTELALVTLAPTKVPTEKPTIPSQPEGEVTLVDIVVTITPTLEVTSTPEVAPTEAIIIPTLIRPATYTFKEGENTFCIARRFNVDIGELLSINSLTTSSVVEIGAVVKMPDTGHPWSSGPRALLNHPTQYTVKSGDSLYSIACMFGDVSPEAIIAVNKLSESVELQAGIIIDIP